VAQLSTFLLKKEIFPQMLGITQPVDPPQLPVSKIRIKTNFSKSENVTANGQKSNWNICPTGTASQNYSETLD
jgi:hypothetical protein